MKVSGKEVQTLEALRTAIVNVQEAAQQPDMEQLQAAITSLVECYNNVRSKCALKISTCQFIVHPEGLWPVESSSPWLPADKRNA